jgi:hypothetical protein
MTTETLARKLGTTEHLSCLRQTARRYGLRTPKDLMDEAVARGCFHYLQSHEPPHQRVSETEFSNEQLALALLSIANPYDPWQIRIGAMMLGAEGNNPATVARNAVYERSESVVCNIARAALRYEPENPFWKQLLAALPNVPDVREGILPHHTRFVSMPGLIGPGKMGKPVWLRPRKIKSLGYAG